MCEFCGCGEPAFRSVEVVIPALHTTEAEPAVAVVSDDEEDDDEYACHTGGVRPVPDARRSPDGVVGTGVRLGRRRLDL